MGHAIATIGPGLNLSYEGGLEVMQMTAGNTHSPTTILTKGSDETFKGLIHVYLAGVLTIIWSYNLAAYISRREAHLLTNSVIYGIAIPFEVYQAWRHFNEG